MGNTQQSDQTQKTTAHRTNKKKSAKALKAHKHRRGDCFACVKKSILINISDECSHQPDYCAKCITHHLHVKISSKGARQFQCLHPKCSVQWEPEHYYQMLDKKHLAIVDKLNLNATLEKMEDFRWCKNPKGCGAGQLISNWKALQGYYSCHACDQEMCFKHDMKWHTGYDCKEFDEELKNNPDLASDKAVLDFSKRCPYCATFISKLEGCDVMKCCRFGTHGCHDSIKDFDKCDHGGKQYCGTIFCWCCLSIIDVDAKNQDRYIRHCKPECQYAELND